MKKLRSINDVIIYGHQDYWEDAKTSSDRLGVIPFNLKGFHHALTSTILSYEAGIGVRHGCFCAHPYVTRLLGVAEVESRRVRDDIKKGNKANIPGAVRISFGFYNTEEEIDQLTDALEKISRKEYKGKYKLDSKLGEYLPENFSFDYSRYFDFQLFQECRSLSERSSV